ncbi:hypothetical protein [Yinghuangia seranimata]|uniref:hypothetical protein n=1 Tax=Yinghuangia seranimata TaxID=408067 RepID=UPI00248C327D|nr:hypothetical protein [Yinghuangia seranimata]MDI2125192.1 hypothetical protein [Yinghuangia seranimata]
MTAPGTAWTRDDADRELARLEGERDAISAGLMALDDHPGRRLLDGAALAGRTKERWEACRADITRLWELYAAYGAVLDEARALRNRRARPSRTELDDIAALLTGTSVAMPGADVPLAQRGLLDPVASARRVSLDVLVAEMNTVWRRAAEMVSAVDDVWSVLLPRLDRVEAAATETAALVDRLGGAQALAVEARVVAETRTRLADARGQVASDPLHFAAATTSARIGTVDLDVLERDLKGVQDGLRQLRLLQERYEERARRVTGLLEVLAADEADGRRRRAHVAGRIARAVPEIPSLAAPLTARNAQVAELRKRDAWPQLSAQLSALERDTAAAAERVRAVRGELDALLARRDELRGLLQAYRAMAGGRGRSEDEALEALHHRAYDVLWRAPCDLDDAARLVGDYQAAVTTPRPGHHRAVGAVHPGIHHEDGAVRPRGEGTDHDDL